MAEPARALPPDPNVLKAAAETEQKRGRGRPKGSKNRPRVDPPGQETEPEEAKGPCVTCGQGDGNPACTACGREVSPLTKEQTDAIAAMWTNTMVMVAEAIGGEGYAVPNEKARGLYMASCQAAWVYRAKLSQHLILGAAIGATAAVVGPAAMHRRAAGANAEKAKAAKAAAPAAPPPTVHPEPGIAGGGETQAPPAAKAA